MWPGTELTASWGWAVHFQVSYYEAVHFWGATSACQTVFSVLPGPLQERKVQSPIAHEETEPQKGPWQKLQDMAHPRRAGRQGHGPCYTICLTLWGVLCTPRTLWLWQMTEVDKYEFKSIDVCRGHSTGWPQSSTQRLYYVFVRWFLVSLPFWGLPEAPVSWSPNAFASQASDASMLQPQSVQESRSKPSVPICSHSMTSFKTS